LSYFSTSKPSSSISAVILTLVPSRLGLNKPIKKRNYANNHPPLATNASASRINSHNFGKAQKKSFMKILNTKDDTAKGARILLTIPLIKKD
jgi:hypothetical protein